MTEPFITIRIRDALGVDKDVEYTEKQVRIMCGGGFNGPALEVASKILERYDALAARLAEAEDQRSSLLATNYDLRKERDRLTDALAETDLRLCSFAVECGSLRHKLAAVKKLIERARNESSDAMSLDLLDDIYAFLATGERT